MLKNFGQNDQKISQYALQTFVPEDEILKEIKARSTRNHLPEIQVGPMDALHLEVLVRLSGARKVVEIGTLGGYSGVCILRGMGGDGRLFTFEHKENHVRVARETFKKYGFDERVEIFEGPAIENLFKIEAQGPFDLIFIDADKESYPQYLAWAGDNLRLGGAVLGDNTFAFGFIANENLPTDNVELRLQVDALRKFNNTAATGGRFRSTVLPTSEGLTIAVKVR